MAGRASKPCPAPPCSTVLPVDQLTQDKHAIVRDTGVNASAPAQRQDAGDAPRQYPVPHSGPAFFGMDTGGRDILSQIFQGTVKIWHRAHDHQPAHRVVEDIELARDTTTPDE